MTSPSARRTTIYLIPGFFGFADIGGIRYFHHVCQWLEEALQQVGVEARVHVVPTLPTASIRDRAARLHDVIVDTAPGDDSPLHLVGHSTGGLDARLYVTPGVSLAGQRQPAPYAARVRSVVTLATPHQGTPLASWFASTLGKRLLQSLSLATLYTLRFGRLPLSAVFQLVGAVARLNGHLGGSPTVLDQLYDELLADFDEERRTIITSMLLEIGRDQSLLRQLTPEGIDLFNAATADRPGVSYGCVLAMAPPPGVFSARHVRLAADAQATHALYQVLHRLTSRHRAVAAPGPEVQEKMLRAWGRLPDARDSDGMVPVLSQVWGTPVCCVTADHLDVCGHFHAPAHYPPHIDWMASGSRFDRATFEGVWQEVAAFLVRSMA